jgi:deoxyhypusine synthase
MPHEAPSVSRKDFLRGQRIDPKPITGRETVPELVDNAFLAYNAGRLAEGCRLFSERMLVDDVTVGMSLTGAMTPAGLGMSTMIPLVEAGFIDWIVSTGANLYHDAHFGLGLAMHRGSPFADDVELRAEGVVRIYDIFFDYEVLLSTDAYIREVSARPEFQRPMSSAEYHYLLGGYVREREQALGLSRKSLLGVAHQCGVPIYTSSPGDSSIGMNVAEQALSGSRLRFDPSADVNETAAIVFAAKTHGGKSGVLIIGGGSPKNFVLQTEPQIQEVLGISEKGHDYYLQLTDARADTGGLSGATPAEAVSWGKVDPDQLPGTVVCYVDNTIGFPILAAYALAKRKPRRLKRLYDRREQLMRQLMAAYQEAKADRDRRAEATTVERRP